MRVETSQGSKQIVTVYTVAPLASLSAEIAEQLFLRASLGPVVIDKRATSLKTYKLNRRNV